MDIRIVFASLEAFSDMLPGVYAVLGLIWLGALAWWVAQKITAAAKPAQPAE